MGLDMESIDQLLMEIKVPSETPCVVRSVREMAYWKASEWRTWLRMIPMILKDYVTNENYDHICKRSYAIWLYLMPNIDEHTYFKVT